LPWKSKFCREKESFAVEKKVLPWQIWATVVLPWKRTFCREKLSFAVADMGHRKCGYDSYIFCPGTERKPKLQFLK